MAVEINWKPSRRDLWMFGGILLPLFLLIVTGLASRRGAPSLLLTVFVTLAAASAAVGWLRPQWMKWLYVGWMVAVFPIGWVVSHILLALIFYGVFTPIGLVMRLCRYDPLSRKIDRQAASYWQTHQKVADTERYFRQY